MADEPSKSTSTSKSKSSGADEPFSTEAIKARAEASDAKIEAGREETAQRVEPTGPPDEQPAGHPKDPTTG